MYISRSVVTKFASKFGHLGTKDFINIRSCLNLDYFTL